jgi:hypothetical protein
MDLIIRPNLSINRKYPSVKIKDFSLTDGESENSMTWKPIEQLGYSEKEFISTNGLNFLCDLGILVFDSGNFRIYDKVANLRNSNVKIGFLLGLLAEGLVVRACQRNQVSNKKFISIARRIITNKTDDNNVNTKYFESLADDNTNKYIAVGTGFAITSTNPQLKAYHNPSSKRDILWIEKDKFSSNQLLIDTKQLNKKISVHAGLQIKTSLRKKGDYFKQLLRRGLCPDYPFIYFDLGDDFNIVRDNLFHSMKEDKLEIYPWLQLEKINTKDFAVTRHHPMTFSTISRFTGTKAYDTKNTTIIKDFDIEYHLVRGRDISPEIHEQLLYYKDLLERIFNNSFNWEWLDTDSLRILDMTFNMNFAFNNNTSNNFSGRINSPIITM